MRSVIPSIWAATAAAAAPALRQMLRRRVARGKEIAGRLPEREGIDATPRPDGQLLWLHAASVGEAQSVLPVLRELAAMPGLTVLMTTGTVTSAAFLAERLPGFGAGRVLHRFVPLDVPAWAARFLDHWRPDAAAFVESELWPNLLAACRRRAIPLMLINARISEHSLRAWRRAPGFVEGVLGSFSRIHPQSRADAERLLSLGATNVGEPGNLKLATPPLAADPAELVRLQACLAGCPVWLASSTHPGEEAVAAAVHDTLAMRHPGLVTIIAPRHPDRGPTLAAQLGAQRRAAGQDPRPGLWLADTLGELGLLYRLARIVFVGRSLVGQGGQNPLEPARLGCAIAMGPYTANFTDPVRRLQEAGGLETVTDAASLARWVGSLLGDPARCGQLGQAAARAASGEAELPATVAKALISLLPAR